MAQLVYICTLCIKYSSYIALDRLGKKEKSLQLINLFKLVHTLREKKLCLAFTFLRYNIVYRL